MNTQTRQWLRGQANRITGPVWTARFRRLAAGLEWPQWGNLRRLRPFSKDHFGFDRGTPIDRYYVDAFFERHRAFIAGDVLEIDDNTYSRRYGQNLRTIHSFDIDPDCGATFVCDLAHCEGILPAESYDCVLMPCTLNVLKELEPALRNALGVVRPGGTILATGAGLIPLDGTEDSDFWHLTPAGWREITRRTWPGCEIIVSGYGNCLAAAAAILGLAQEELSSRELEYQDETYPVATTVFCRKPALSSGNPALL